MDSTNPLGIIGIDHLEFTTDQLEGEISQVFKMLGMEKIESDPTTQSALYQQADIRFVLTANQDRHSSSHQYWKKHGDGVSQISFLVENAEQALEMAIGRGGKLVSDLVIKEDQGGKYSYAAIQGFGDVLNQFIQRPSTNPSASFRPNFKKGHITNNKLSSPLLKIDHLTNNVPKGEMDHWVNFYKQIYGFVETRYFDIKGVKTGLQSKVVQLANNQVIIPINEPESDGGKSQIQEFLDRHKGAGVQHIALSTGDIISSVKELQKRGMKFLDIPSTYYEDIPKRNFTVTEDLEVLKERQILVDGDPKGHLLQIFSDTYIGPLFYEIIQRKNHFGFGEGNFQALFEAIERDQQQRGYL